MKEQSTSVDKNENSSFPLCELGEIVDKKAEYMLSIYNEIQNMYLI